MASRQVPTQKKEPPRAQTVTRPPNKKQQIKQALALQSAHIITSDFQMLSQPLDNGILLMDRTERKLKLVKSLGELLPQHQYTTEYGNVLERTSKHKVLLAGSIELDVTTDEARFDEVLQQLAPVAPLPQQHGLPLGELQFELQRAKAPREQLLPQPSFAAR